ncbi:MAG: YdiU family protein [Proteobacteria bacterium]|nr:YdiU family protein [Pseudomonadota bacterium]MBU1584525.1 YdiU family protein [Pseudomonadota bacterium]MBU2451718.1 YdiU family protein [Pseudomonadota bacterium]MBU2631541.1 YdiU family protein [Pseudomonadota bacterium]
MTYATPISDGKESIEFDNRFVRELPQDPETANTRRQVLGACYSRVNPTQVSSPKLVAYSREVAALVGFSKAFCESEAFTRVFAGNLLMPGMEPYAACYGGHQFGNWAGQLGDGRAINLGEIVNQHAQRWVLQLKGAGPTPYSRTADGLAVLRSSIREFLCSEAMFHLGVPTTRALSLVLTGEDVERDMFYDGHPKLEPGAVVCRVSPSFTRFGNFEIFASRGEIKVLKQLADYTIRTDFPHLGEPSQKVYVKWFEEICRRTADMILHWMRVGFVHGVMNTDNLSILGLTIDYGPYGWLEDYTPGWTPNTTDAGTKRYCFGNQPQIAQWNLVKLANALYPIIGTAAPLQAAVDFFGHYYQKGFQTMMADKLGLTAFVPGINERLVKELLEILSLVETDMTIFFRRLALLDTQGRQADDMELTAARAVLMDAYYAPEKITNGYWERFNAWLETYILRIKKDNLQPEKRREKMDAVNPKYVLRNYLAQLSIDKAEQGDFSMIRDLQDLFRHPYDEQPDKEKFAEKRPDWARSKPGCSMLSCSS